MLYPHLYYNDKIMAYEQLRLDNQLCFPIYATSRLITREYKPYLDALRITYPQYLVLMVLWEEDGQAVNDIAKKLILNTNTITPLLKRMEQEGLVLRRRSDTDERKVMVRLSDKGQALENEAAQIPQALISRLAEDKIDVENLIKLRDSLQGIISFLSD